MDFAEQLALEFSKRNNPKFEKMQAITGTVIEINPYKIQCFNGAVFLTPSNSYMTTSCSLRLEGTCTIDGKIGKSEVEKKLKTGDKVLILKSDKTFFIVDTLI